MRKFFLTINPMVFLGLMMVNIWLASVDSSKFGWSVNWINFGMACFFGVLFVVNVFIKIRSGR